MFSNQIRKFFDVTIPEPAGGAVDTSIASLMAKQGVVNNGQIGVAEPINIEPEKKDESTASSTAAPVETTTPASNDAAKSEPPQPQETKEIQQPPIAAEPPKVPTLQEVLKNQQPDTVLKELGYDDNLVKFLSGLNGQEIDKKLINFLNTWKDKGDYQGYLKEWTTDYSKMSAEDVMRHQLQKDYPTATPPQLEALFKREVVKAYSLDSTDEDEVAEGRLLLEARADRSRTGLIEAQKNFLFPTPPEPKAAEPDNREQQMKQEFETYKSSLQESPYTKDITANKRISFGEGEEKYNHPVDPNALSEVLLNPDKWAASMFNKDGTPDIEKQYLMACIAVYGKGFLVDYAKHYKSLGGKSAIEPIENASKPGGETAASTEAAPKNPAEAMARQGRLVNP